MPQEHFISYSRRDGSDFALRLRDHLRGRDPKFPVWIDREELHAGEKWSPGLSEAIDGCATVLYLLTRASVSTDSFCLNEVSYAQERGKPIIPIMLHPAISLPISLQSVQYLDFTRALNSEEEFDSALSSLKLELQRRVKLPNWGAANGRPTPASSGTASQASPSASGAGGRVKVVNDPPVPLPPDYLNRDEERKLLHKHLGDDSARLITVRGAAGMGKTALACRVLKDLECGQQPAGVGAEAIVYLSGQGPRHITFTNIYEDLCKLLPNLVAEQLEQFFKNAQLGADAKMSMLLSRFRGWRVVLLLDNIDLLMNSAREIKDPEVDQALRAVISEPPHGVKIVLTTGVAPKSLSQFNPLRQKVVTIKAGFDLEHTKLFLQRQDDDGSLGLRDATDEQFAEAQRVTEGYPRVLELLLGRLRGDTSTSLTDVVNDLREGRAGELFNATFSQLDEVAQRVVQALAIYSCPLDRPVEPRAIQHLLGIPDSKDVLGRLENLFLVKRVGNLYSLKGRTDRAAAFGSVPPGDKADRDAKGATPFTRHALLARAADFFKKEREARPAPARLEDLEPHRAEFDLRLAAQDYEAAAGVLLEIDLKYLLPWGYYQEMKRMHEQLLGKIEDPRLREKCTGNLGTTHYKLGNYAQALKLYGEALEGARAVGDRVDESRWLSNLGNCYNLIGRTRDAVTQYEEAQLLDEANEDRLGLRADLCNLGVCYTRLGETRRAIEYFQQAIEIDRAEKSPQGESLDLGNLADVLLFEGRYKEAAKQAEECIAVAKTISHSLALSLGHAVLSYARLYLGNIAGAREAARIARTFNEPHNNHQNSLLLGIVELRGGDCERAREAFEASVSQADELLLQSPQYYDALDTKCLALCGLTLCNGGNRVADAINIYRAARAINKDPGVVAQTQRLLNLLTPADPGELLSPVESLISGY